MLASPRPRSEQPPARRGYSFHRAVRSRAAKPPEERPSGSRSQCLSAAHCSSARLTRSNRSRPVYGFANNGSTLLGISVLGAPPVVTTTRTPGRLVKIHSASSRPSIPSGKLISVKTRSTANLDCRRLRWRWLPHGRDSRIRAGTPPCPFGRALRLPQTIWFPGERDARAQDGPTFRIAEAEDVARRNF